MDARTVPLGELTLKIGSGATPRGGKESYKSEGIALFRSLNVYDLQFDASGLAYIDDEQAGQLANVEVLPGDVLLNITGASVARCALAPTHLLPARVNQHVAILRPDPELLDGRFLNYTLVSPRHKGRLLAIAQGGATREALTKRTLEQFDIPVPPLQDQRKIAAVLAAYDELIENNLRRIEILEAMAQAVYREWFVNFRFPGHEDVALVDSPLGPIPEGWEVARVNEAFEILGGATPSTKRAEYWEGGTINWYTPSDLTAHGHMFIDESSRKVTPEGLAGCSATLFPAGSVMMTSRATLGVVAINLEPACTNQGFITCLPNDRVSASHLYFWIKSNLPLIESLASGATFKEITKRAFRQIDFLIPMDNVGQAFSESVEPMLSLVANLVHQNANLRSTRDFLLPKLVSGGLDVSDLDIDTEWLAS